MASEETATSRGYGRLGGTLSGTRALARVVYRDPEHVAERLTLYASQHLAEPARAWAEAELQARPDVPRAQIADDIRTHAARVARIDGAVAGTPFYVALVPGYLAYLWQEGSMGMRTAALYGADPAAVRTQAEMLALRGVHPTAEAAEKALIEARDTPAPPKPQARRTLRTWVRSVRALLVFGGFLSMPADENERARITHRRLRTVAGLLVAGAIWLVTWVMPVTFMIAMAWACESHTRQLGRRMLAHYDGKAATTQEAIAAADRREDRGHDRRQIVRTVALTLSIVIPIGFVAYADHVRHSTGINWLGALGALVALSVVIATFVFATRR
jgi:hypothetical protein